MLNVMDRNSCGGQSTNSQQNDSIRLPGEFNLKNFFFFVGPKFRTDMLFIILTKVSNAWLDTVCVCESVQVNV